MENVIPNFYDSTTSITNHDEIDLVTQQSKGGCQKGTTNINKKLVTDSSISANNEILELYSKAKENDIANKIENKALQKIIDNVKQKIRLLEGADIKRATI